MHQQEQQLGVGPSSPSAGGGACVIAGSVAVFGLSASPMATFRPPAQKPPQLHHHHPPRLCGRPPGRHRWRAGLGRRAFTAPGHTRAPVRQGVLGRLGAASVLVGAAIFIVDFSIDVAGQALASAWAAALASGASGPGARRRHRLHDASRDVADLGCHPLGVAAGAVLGGPCCWRLPVLAGLMGLAVGAATIVGADDPGPPAGPVPRGAALRPAGLRRPALEPCAWHPDVASSRCRIGFDGAATPWHLEGV